VKDAPGFTGRDRVGTRRGRSGSPTHHSPPAKKKPEPIPAREKTEVIRELERIQQAQAELQQRQADLLSKLKGDKPPKVPVHAKGTRHCQVCLKVFKSHARLLKHVDTAHLGERRHECGRCGKSFASASYGRAHEKACKGAKSPPREPRYVCVDCNAEYTEAWELAQHVKGHPKGGSWVCPHACGKSYKTEASLRSHRSNCPKAPGFQKKECLYCDRQYTRQGDLNTHMRLDHGFTGGRGKPKK
jgi:uncharacterized C2H2 Zn-finger protein